MLNPWLCSLLVTNVGMFQHCHQPVTVPIHTTCPVLKLEYGSAPESPHSLSRVLDDQTQFSYFPVMNCVSSDNSDLMVALDVKGQAVVD